MERNRLVKMVASNAEPCEVAGCGWQGARSTTSPYDYDQDLTHQSNILFARGLSQWPIKMLALGPGTSMATHGPMSKKGRGENVREYVCVREWLTQLSIEFRS